MRKRERKRPVLKEHSHSKFPSRPGKVLQQGAPAHWLIAYLGQQIFMVQIFWVIAHLGQHIFLVQIFWVIPHLGQQIFWLISHLGQQIVLVQIFWVIAHHGQQIFLVQIFWVIVHLGQKIFLVQIFWIISHIGQQIFSAQIFWVIAHLSQQIFLVQIFWVIAHLGQKIFWRATRISTLSSGTLPRRSLNSSFCLAMPKTSSCGMYMIKPMKRPQSLLLGDRCMFIIPPLPAGATHSFEDPS